MEAKELEVGMRVFLETDNNSLIHRGVVVKLFTNIVTVKWDNGVESTAHCLELEKEEA